MKRQYFEDMYGASTDPWGFTSRWYEERKYALTIGALRRARYRSAFEPGCSIGVLTSRLAMRCERLVAMELVGSAAAQARARTSDLPYGAGQVTVLQGDVSGDPWPDGPFDLVVFSELLYYFEQERVTKMLRGAVDRLTEDGDLLLVHWRPRVPEYPLTGDEVHELARSSTGLQVAGHYRDDDLVLDLLARPGSPSVATTNGLRMEPPQGENHR